MAEKYCRRMWVPQPTSISMVTPLKRKNIQDQMAVDTSHNFIMQPLNRPRHIPNKISRCLNFEREDEVEEHYTQTENGHGIPTDSRTARRVTQLRSMSPQNDSEEEVIYSEEGPYEELYLENTWDSDKEVQEDDNYSRSGWI